jgi:hypothetical protein
MLYVASFLRSKLLFPTSFQLQKEYTAKNQYRKFETNIPRKGIAWPQSQFPMSVSNLYIHTIDLPTLLQEI